MNQIIKKLLNKNISISVAESCTGGQLCKFFTDNPGVSKIFNLGIVTYSNQSKKKLLNINDNILKKHGSVSKKVAYLMSYNLFKISKSDICISTTGIAGPSGKTKLKPIGLVFIGFTFNKKTYVLKKNFKGSRKKIQKDTVLSIIKEINKLI